MGRVVLARDPVLDRDVAVKLLRDDLGLPPELKLSLFERMRQEARASARVRHPNIVALHDMGDDPDLGLYLVFEFIDGETLKARVERGALSAQGAALLARQLGDALSTAHAAGVVHRDVKPENVILAATGAKIADFGIARVPDSTLTRDGGLLGTPAYSAPEALGAGKFSPLSDQFSMAATLYEAVSGQRAFPGDDAVAVASRIATDDAAPFALACGLSPLVDQAFARALARDPSARFGSAAAFGHALAEALELTFRPAMATMPDRHHLDVEELYAEAGASRAKRIAAGGAAVGALLAIAALQLVAPLRSPPAVPVASTHVAAPPIGWLAESHRTAKAHRVATTRAKRNAIHADAGANALLGARHDGGVSSDKASSGHPDAGAPPVLIDEL
jgi:serine/threonine-protein kinase